MSRPTSTGPCTAGLFPSNRIHSVVVSGTYNYMSSSNIRGNCYINETAQFTFSGAASRTTDPSLVTPSLFYLGEGCCNTGGVVDFGTPFLTGNGNDNIFYTPTMCNGSPDSGQSFTVAGSIILAIAPVQPTTGLCTLTLFVEGGSFDFFPVTLTFPVSQLLGTHNISFTDPTGVFNQSATITIS